jgi:hypothetical protein
MNGQRADYVARYGLGPISFGRAQYEPDEDWMPKSMLCRCSAPVLIVHSSSRQLSIADEGELLARDDHVTSWHIECESGHVLLHSHDIYEDSESPDDPTVEQLRGWLGEQSDGETP